MKIVLFGAYKTGTTALFYLLKNALGTGVRTLFEPQRYLPAPGDKAAGVLAKVILGVPNQGRRVDYSSFLGFEKKILLVRDPRDWLISGMLFMIQQVPALYADAARFDAVLAMLRQKETNPASLPVKTMLARLLALRPDASLEIEIDWMRRHLRWLLDFDAHLHGHLRFPYEAFVEDRWEALEAYLGLKLYGPAVVAPAHDHVTRTKSCGHWRHWFLPEDMAFFQPIFEDYLRQYGYPLTWDLAPRPRIPAAHGSAYILRTVAKRTARAGSS